MSSLICVYTDCLSDCYKKRVIPVLELSKGVQTLSKIMMVQVDVEKLKKFMATGVDGLPIILMQYMYV